MNLYDVLKNMQQYKNNCSKVSIYIYNVNNIYEIIFLSFTDIFMFSSLSNNSLQILQLNV